MRIGVFDSGLGGLSIAGAIRRALPDVDLAYCCDNLNFPYGTKSEGSVIEAATDVTSRFFHQASIDVLVIACNTASVVALEAIRANLPIRVVGVVPAVKPAALASKSKIIGILATPVTIRRPYLDDLIKKFAFDCKVVKSGSSRLVTLAEDKMRGRETSPISDDELRAEMKEIVEASSRGLDQLVLGCTHFPLIVDELRRVLPATVRFVDSGDAVASRVGTVLEELGCKLGTPKGSAPGGLLGFCSGEPFEISLPDGLGPSDRKFELLKLP